MVASRYADMVVAGGGPAGLATAIRARLKGLDVIVLEALRPVIDKACGEGLMPDGVARLQELGVEIGDRGRPFRGIRYLDADTTAEGRFPDEPGMGVRRTELHGALCRRAEEIGVRLFWGVGVRGLLADGFHTDRGEVRGRWLVGADGRHSLVRRWAGSRRWPGHPPQIRNSPALSRRTVDRSRRGLLGGWCGGLRDPGRPATRRRRADDGRQDRRLRQVAGSLPGA